MLHSNVQLLFSVIKAIVLSRRSCRPRIFKSLMKEREEGWSNNELLQSVPPIPHNVVLPERMSTVYLLVEFYLTCIVVDGT